MSVLATLGLTVEASQEEVIEYVNRVAAGLVRTGPEVVVWLGARISAPTV